MTSITKLFHKLGETQKLQCSTETEGSLLCCLSHVLKSYSYLTIHAGASGLEVFHKKRLKTQKDCVIFQQREQSKFFFGYAFRHPKITCKFNLNSLDSFILKQNLRILIHKTGDDEPYLRNER